MGGSAEFRTARRTQQEARNAIDEFLTEHNNRGGIYEGYAYEYITGIASATQARNHDMVVTINKTANLEYSGNDLQYKTQIKKRYDDMRKAITKLYRNPQMLNQLLSDYGIEIKNSTINNGTMDLTFSFTDRNGKSVTRTVQFDKEMSRFPGLV